MLTARFSRVDGNTYRNMEGKAAKSTILSTAAGGCAGLDSAVSSYSEKLLSKLLLKAHYWGKNILKILIKNSELKKSSSVFHAVHVYFEHYSALERNCISCC